MALFLFTDNIIKDKPIKVFNYGNMLRDFTYIDDIIEGIVRLITTIPKAVKQDEDKEYGDSLTPYKIYNIGNNNPVNLEDFISILENKLNKKAIKEYLPMQPGDVSKTYADVSELENDINYKPCTNVEEGIERFVAWYKEYYHITS
jgi:UDP-glucuronate 4-epimerase